jgi:hypothetical protein
VRSVRADDQPEPARRGFLEGDGDCVRVLIDLGDGVVEEVLRVRQRRLVQQTGEVVAEDLDLGDDPLAVEAVGGHPRGGAAGGVDECEAALVHALRPGPVHCRWRI